MSTAAVQPLNLLFTREAIAAQVNAVKAKMLLAPPPGSAGGLYAKVDGLQKLAPSLERIVTLPLDGSVAFDGEGLTPEAAPNEREAADPDRIVALLPTGGTTGAPKVVPLSNRNVVSSAIGSMLAIGVNRATGSSPRRRCFTSAALSAQAWRASVPAPLWSFPHPVVSAIPTWFRISGASSTRNALPMAHWCRLDSQLRPQLRWMGQAFRACLFSAP